MTSPIKEFVSRMRELIATALANAELLENDPRIPDAAKRAVKDLVAACRKMKDLLVKTWG